MSTTLAATDAAAVRGPLSMLEAPEDLFARQPTRTEMLPDPHVVVPRFVQALVDVMAAQRPVSQLAGWTTGDVQAQLVHLAAHAAEATTSDRRGWHRHRVMSVRITLPADGVVEASAVVRNSRRSRALALRMEGLDGRWRCTALRSA